MLQLSELVKKKKKREKEKEKRLRGLEWRASLLWIAEARFGEQRSCTCEHVLAHWALLPVSLEGRGTERMKPSTLVSTGPSHHRIVCLCHQGPLKSIMLCDFHFWLPLCACVITL